MQPKQEKVFEQALQIEQNLSKLDNDVQRCFSMLENTDRSGQMAIDRYHLHDDPRKEQ